MLRRLAGLLLTLAACDPPPAPSPLARMVDALAARGIRDAAVLEAMRKVPRDEFVRPEDRPFAFEDRAFPVGHGRTVSQPYVVARMIELAGIRPGARVLELGTASGYQTAILAEMGAEVRTVEAVPDLVRRALERFGGAARVKVRQGDGRDGWPEEAPFQAILIRSAVDQPPVALLRQVADGGRIVAPVGDETFGQRLVRMTRHGDDWTREEFDRVRFAPLVGADR